MKLSRWVKMCVVLVLVVLVALISAVLIAPSVAHATTDSNSSGLVSSIKVEAGKAPTVPQVLLDIAYCESGNNQKAIGYNYRYVNGKRTVSSRDIGMFQINERYHAKSAKALGMDIYTQSGNTAYALYLYKRNGTRDWNASRHCWSNIKTWKARQKTYY